MTHTDSHMLQDTRERMIRLEGKVEHVEEQLDDMQPKLTEMHDLLMQARGARWIVVATASFAGFAASIASKFMHLPFDLPG